MKDLYLKIKISADGKSFTAEVGKVKQQIGAIGQESANAGKGADRLAESLKRVGHYGMAAGASWVGISQIKQGFDALLSTASKFDSIQKGLQAVTGSAEAAGREYQFLQSTANQLGLVLSEVSRSYVNLAASAKGTALEGRQTEAIFSAVSRSMAALGKSSAETEGALLAVSQMISKGGVTAEELRGQLSERLPGAFNAMARAVGVSTIELSKMLEQGRVGLDVLPLLANELNKLSASADFSGISNNLNRLSNEWESLKKSLSDSVPINDGLQGIASSIKAINGHVDTLIGVVKSALELLLLFSAAKVVGSIVKYGVKMLEAQAATTATAKAAELATAKLGPFGEKIWQAEKAASGLTERATLAETAVGLFGKGAEYVANNKLKLLSNALMAAAIGFVNLREKAVEASSDFGHEGIGKLNEQIAELKFSLQGNSTGNVLDQLGFHLANGQSMAATQDEIKLLEAKRQKLLEIESHRRRIADDEAKDDQEAARRLQINELLAESEDWYAETVIDDENKRYKAREDAANKLASAADSAAKAQASHYQQATEALEKQIALHGDKTRAGEMEWEAAHGMYKNLDDASKLRLLNLSAELDYIDKIAAEQKDIQTVKAIPHFTEGGQNLEAYDAADKAINAEMDAAAKSAEEYDKWLNTIDDSLKRMGATSADVFDGALGGIHLLTGAISDLTSQMSAYAEAQAANAEQLAEAQKNPIANAALIAKGMAKEKQLAKEKSLAEIDGAARVAGATAALFDKKTALYKAFHVMEIGLSAIRMAAQVKEMVISVASGAAKFFSQSGWLGFAGVAAMLAVMAGLGFSKSGSSTVGTANIPTSPDSGTVLGDTAEKSDSVNNAYKLLQDIHAKEYRELRGINAGVSALSKGITDSITKLFQSGGLPTPDNLNLGKASASLPNSKVITSIDPLQKFLMNGIFGTTKRELTGSGIDLFATKLADLMGGGAIRGQQYSQITTTKKSWFSKKTTVSEITGPLDTDFTGALTEMFKGMGASMIAMATEFGTDLTDTVNQYVIPRIKVNLHGMSSEDMIKTLNNVISTQLDNMTTAIFGNLVAKYQKLGEGLFETATRLIAQKAVVLDAIDMVGSTFKGDAIEMADGLIALAGGIKEFQALFQDYYSKFYTDEEKLANTTRRLIANLSDFGLSLPDTRTAYRDLVNAQQLETEAGRERYNQLLSLAEAADAYYTELEKSAKQLAESAKQMIDSAKQASKALIDAAWGAADSAFSALQKSVDAEKNKISASIDIVNASISKLTSLSRALRSTLEGLSMPGQERQDRAVAQAQITTALAIARTGGVLPDEDSLRKALSVVSQPSDNLFASFVDYQRDFYRTARDINDLADISDEQLSKEEKSLRELQDQTAALDAILTNAQMQLDALRGVNNALLSVADALLNFNGATNKIKEIKAAEEAQKDFYPGSKSYVAAQTSGAAAAARDGWSTGSVAATWAADKSQYLAVYNSALKNGQTLSTLDAIFSQSPGTAAQFADKYGMPKFASGGLHTGGYRIVGEHGPELEYTGPSRIYSNSDSKGLLSQAELIAEVRALRAEIRAGQAQIASNTKDTTKQLQRWDVDGLPATTTL